MIEPPFENPFHNGVFIIKLKHCSGYIPLMLDILSMVAVHCYNFQDAALHWTFQEISGLGQLALRALSMSCWVVI
jgi:hypothetical protein